MLTIVDYDDDSNETGQAVGAGRSLLDEIVRDGARQMLAAALQAEVADAARVLRPGGRILAVHHYGRDDVAPLFPDRAAADAAVVPLPPGRARAAGGRDRAAVERAGA